MNITVDAMVDAKKFRSQIEYDAFLDSMEQRETQDGVVYFVNNN